jgi:hypothetical protein
VVDEFHMAIKGMLDDRGVPEEYYAVRIEGMIQDLHVPISTHY